VRWSRDGAVLASGRLSTGLAELTWLAPGTEGVYTVQVELFPVPPPAGADFLTQSPIRATARLFVSSTPAPGGDELGPPGSYFALFHFNGSLRDEAGDGQAELIGGARLALDGPAPGYFLPGASGAGIRYERPILPPVEGRLQPCTLTLGLIPPQEPQPSSGGNLLSVDFGGPGSGGEGGSALRIRRGPDGELAAFIETAGAQIRLASGISQLQAGRLARLDLSLIPESSSLRVMWFLDGRQTAAQRVDFSAALDSVGQTLVGGEDNMECTLTELGVYYRDESGRPAVDPAIYRAAAQRRHGGQLVLAEGFEGLYAPESWTVGGQVLPGDGLLLLPPGSSLRLPYFELGAGETLLSLQFGKDLPEESRVSLFWEDHDEPFAVVEPRGLLADPLKPKEALSFAPAGSRLELVLSESSLAPAGSPGSLPLSAPAGKASWLTVRIQSPRAASAAAAARGRPETAEAASAEAPSAAVNLGLDSLLIYRR